MSSRNYAESLKRVLVHEGGKVDHPKDPGGRTAYGITCVVYDAYRSRKGLGKRDVFLIDEKEKNEIYRFQYWDKIHGDELPKGVDYVVFDGAVNSGPVQSIKWLQRALGINPADGMLGEYTLNALEEWDNYDDLIEKICNERMAFLKSLRTWGTFGKGWSRRVEEVRTVGKIMSDNRKAPKPKKKDLVPEPTPKAEPSDIDKPSTTIQTVGPFTVLIGMITDAVNKLEAFASQNKWVSIAVAVLVIGGIALTGYQIFKNMKAKQVE